MDFYGQENRPEDFIIRKLGERPMPGKYDYEDNPSLSPDLHINLYFACQVYVARWITNEQGSIRQRVSRTLVGKLTNCLELTFDSRYKYFPGVAAAIKNRLRDWPVSKSTLDRLVQKLVTDLQNDVCRKDFSSGKHVMDFHVKVVVQRNHTLVRPFIIDRMIETLVAEGGRAMIPATDLSIQSLESKTLCSAASCTICMDEISAGCEGVLLPCEHLFHRDCVTKWLRASHQCPVCRYKMPTS